MSKGCEHNNVRREVNSDERASLEQTANHRASLSVGQKLQESSNNLMDLSSDS